MKSQAERSLQSILKDQPLVFSGTLRDLLPEANFASRSEQIKRNISDFIQNCLTNNKLVQEMIQRGIKNDQFSSQYQKSLALFSVEMLSGDFGDSYKLFIKDDEQKKSLRKSKNLKNESQIEQQIQQDQSQAQDHFVSKYSNLITMLQYIHKPLSQLSQICMNYFVKIFSNIINNKAQDVYIYFDRQYTKKQSVIQQNSAQENVTSSMLKQNQKKQLQYLIEHAYNFGGVSQMFGKMVAQQGSVNKYVNIKHKIIQIILSMLKSDNLIKINPNNYQYLLDFVSSVLSRTKYRSEDQTQQITKISQRFVDEDIIWYFKEKLVKAALDSNALLGNNYMTSSRTLNKSESSKCPRKDQLKPQNQEQFEVLQNIFQNSTAYLRIIIQRINSEQQYQQDLSQSMKYSEPTMDFQVQQALFGQNSLYQLLTLPVPFQYKNLNKMWYYEFLLKLTRNSRYKKQNHQKQTGLLPSFLMPILIHLLKTFRKQYRHNGLVNFYVQELMCESILPRIQKFDNKQAMMVLSALNPSQDIINKYDDTKAYSQKILIIMRRKCQWFSDHVSKIGIDLNAIHAKYITKLGGNTSVLQNRKNTVKQLTFLYQKGTKPQEQKENLNVSKSQRCQDNDSSDEDDKFLGTFNPRREFFYPQNTQKSSQQIVISKTADLQENLFKRDEQIKQQINAINSDILQGDKSQTLQIPKQKIQLLIDSAGQQQEQNQVITEDMYTEQPGKK